MELECPRHFALVLSYAISPVLEACRRRLCNAQQHFLDASRGPCAWRGPSAHKWETPLGFQIVDALFCF